MTDTRKLPIGTVTQRSDGSVWRKDEHGKDMTHVKGATHRANLPAAKPSHTPGSSASGWQAMRASLDLDGHLPDDTIHPAKVQVDLEGDIDSKPVFSWHDQTGRRRNTYTHAFHQARATHLQREVGRVAPNLVAGYHLLTDALANQEADSFVGGCAAACAATHLLTGHRVRDLLQLKRAHASIMGGTNISPDLVVQESAPEGEEKVEKSYGHIAHPDRVHLMMTHPNGSIYPTTFVDKHVADHIMTGDWADVGGPLFKTTEAEVRKALESVGVGDVPEHVVRHHAVSRLAADYLSKQEPIDLGAEGGLEKFRQHVNQASQEIGRRFGHAPAPELMSYVPPHVVAAYAEGCGAHKLWPKAFKPLEKSCTSPNADSNSSTELSGTSSPTLTTPSASTPPTSPPSPRTPTPSQQRSPTIRGMRWQDAADEVERYLSKSYGVRLPPLADDTPPRYGDSLEATPDDIVAGVRLHLDGSHVDVLATNDERALLLWGEVGLEMRKSEVAAMAAKGPSDRFATLALTRAKRYRLKKGRDFSPQALIDKWTKPKDTKELRAKRGYLRRAVKLAKLARAGDEKALVELNQVIGALHANPMAMEFRTDTLSKSDGEAYHYADGTFVLVKGARGPDGDPVGTVRQHADGSRWEKREDGWHELAEGSERDTGGDEDTERTQTVGHQHALRVLGTLRDQLDNTSDPSEVARIKKQIALVRQRIAGLVRDERAGQEKRPNDPKLSEHRTEVAMKSFVDDMHKYLRGTISKSRALTPEDAIIEVVMGDDLVAQAELRSLAPYDTKATVLRWMRGQ